MTIFNVGLSGNKLINKDFKTPEVVYAEFSGDLSKQTKKEIVNVIDIGSKMIQAYKSRRDNLHVVNVVELIEELESLFNAFEIKNI